MSLIWIPPQTTVPPFFVAARAAGTNAPTGAKISAASSGSGGITVESAGPFGAETTREILRHPVARPGECENPAALVAGDLRDDMSGGAETVDSDGAGVAGHAQRAIADQPGAHQRRRLDIAVDRVDRKAIALVGDGQLGITAIDLIPGEPGAVAQILATAAAIFADPAGPAEPRHADPVADREAVDLRPLLDDRTDDLVAEDERQLGIGKLAVDDMQIGAAHRAGAHRNQHLLRPRTRRGQFRRDQRPSRCRQQLRMHRLDLATPGLKSNASPRSIVPCAASRSMGFRSLAAGLLSLVAGCHLVPSGGMADRCADIMHAGLSRRRHRHHQA